MTGPASGKRRNISAAKPTILVLTTSYPSDAEDPSGVFVAKLLVAIKRRGYSIKVVAPSNGLFHGRRVLDGIETVRFGYFWPRSLERLTTAAGGIPESIAGSVLARFQLVPMMAAFLIRSLLEIRGANIVYANWLGAGIIGAAASLFTRKPLFVSFRGDDGYLARDRLLWRIITRWVIRRSAMVIPVSRELGEILLNLGTPSEKCHVAKFGIDTKMFHPAPPSGPVGDTVGVLFVGSLIARKGLQDLLEALADRDLQSARLTVVGDGPSAGEFAALSERLGISDRIQWKGIQAPATVAELMRNSDILCLPSYMEGRPNVINEAMASGIPVISTRIGGIPDMVADGETAFLVRPGDIPELRRCLRELIRDRPLRLRMGKAGYDFLMRSGATWDATAEEFDRLFRQVSNLRSASSV